MCAPGYAMPRHSLLVEASFLLDIGERLLTNLRRGTLDQEDRAGGSGPVELPPI